MALSSTLLLVKTLALSLINLSARIEQTFDKRALSHTQWPGVLDKTIELYTNLSCSGPGGASEAYGVIFPGTLWCGKGSKAKSFDELGVFKGPDVCCRDHDHCPDSIYSHATKHGLHNAREFATTLCACDHKLLQCLRADGSVIAREVGRLYFDFLDPVCFSYDYPVKRCKRRDKGDANRRCVEYEYDTSRRPEWHFEDFPFFYGSYRAEDEVDVAAEGAAALAGQERPDAAANGEDAELWNALLMNRHVRFGSYFGDHLEERMKQAMAAARAGQDADGVGWEAFIGDQVFSSGSN